MSAGSACQDQGLAVLGDEPAVLGDETAVLGEETVVPGDLTAVLGEGLAVLARACRPDGEAGTEGEADAVPQVPGFVLSSFNPLVADVAERCLRQRFGEPPLPPDAGRSVAVIVVSASGDLTSAGHVARTVDAGRRVGPLLFFQSVPNSIAGHVTARWGLGGPVVCLCPVGDPMADGLAQAAVLINDGDATAALVVLVEQSGADGERASANAVLVGATDRAADKAVDRDADRDDEGAVR